MFNYKPFVPEIHICGGLSIFCPCHISMTVNILKCLKLVGIYNVLTGLFLS